MSGWIGDYGMHSGHFGFYLYAVTHAWIALLITFIFILVKVPTHCGIINWDLTVSKKYIKLFSIFFDLNIIIQISSLVYGLCAILCFLIHRILKF